MAQQHRLLADPTRLAIYEALRHSDRTISELVDLVGVHPNTVRAHLRLLKEAGVLSKQSSSVSTGGRPADLYRLAEEHLTFEPEWPLLLDSFATTLRNRRGERGPKVMESEGMRQGFKLAHEVPERPGETPIARLAAILRRIPFSPQITRSKDRLSIELHSCPFWGKPIERNGDLICTFHLGLLKGVAETAASSQAKVSLTPLVMPNLCVAAIDLNP